MNIYVLPQFLFKDLSGMLGFIDPKHHFLFVVFIIYLPENSLDPPI
jgi:hypothetical protein